MRYLLVLLAGLCVGCTPSDFPIDFRNEVTVLSVTRLKTGYEYKVSQGSGTVRYMYSNERFNVDDTLTLFNMGYEWNEPNLDRPLNHVGKILYGKGTQ